MKLAARLNLGSYYQAPKTSHCLGVYAVVVEAKDAEAEACYRKFGFRLCDAQTRQLYLPLGEGNSPQ